MDLVTAIFAGTNEPDDREATGSQLVNYDILGNRVTDGDRMEATGHVFLDIFALGHIHVVRRAVPDLAVPTCSSWLIQQVVVTVGESLMTVLLAVAPWRVLQYSSKVRFDDAGAGQSTGRRLKGAYLGTYVSQTYL